MKPQPAATPWTGLSLALVLGGAVGLSLAGTAWWSMAERPSPSGERPAGVPVASGAIPPSPTKAATILTADQITFAPSAPLASRLTPRPEATEPNTPAAEPTYLGGMVQHLAAEEDTLVIETAESSPTSAPAAGVPQTTEIHEAPTPVVRTGLSRPRSPDAADASETDTPSSAPSTDPAPTATDATDPAALGLFEVQQDEAPLSLTAEERFQQDVQKFISFYNVGWSSKNPEHRFIGWGIATHGWSTFVRLHIKPQVNRGVRRFQLHNPFGVLEDEAMLLDQYLHAQEAGLVHVTTGFVEAWKPITDQGVEIIAYVGCGTHDEDFNNLPLDQWLDRAFRSVQPFIDANMSIALDAAAEADRDTPTHVFAEQLRARGVKVYVEAKPARSRPHWFDFNVISLDQTWLNTDINTGHPQAKFYGIPNDLLTGEIIRMVRPRTDETWEDLEKFPVTHGRIRDILDDGNSVSIMAYHWFKQGRTLRDLLYVDDRQAAYD